MIVWQIIILKIVIDVKKKKVHQCSPQNLNGDLYFCFVKHVRVFASYGERVFMGKLLAPRHIVGFRGSCVSSTPKAHTDWLPGRWVWLQALWWKVATLLPNVLDEQIYQ